jgi:hypothetical protein
MQKSAKHNNQTSTMPQVDTNDAGRLDSPEGRAQVAAVDIILATDPDQGTRAVLYGRETLQEIIQSGIGRNAMVLNVSLDSASNEFDRLEALIREVKGNSSFRPDDLFPEFEIDAASFGSETDLLGAVGLALEEIASQHRTLLPKVQLRFYYSAKAAGFTTANEELRQAAQRAEEPIAYIYSMMTLGSLLYDRLPAGLIKPTRCVDIAHGVGIDGRNVGIKCRSLQAKTTPHGPAYHSQRMPRMRFGADRRERLVAFSEHALERICERTVYNWRTFCGHGDAFAFLDNCVYFEDCTDVRGEPSFVVYNACTPHFHSWDYVKHVLGIRKSFTLDANADIAELISDSRFYYRVGYCPVTFHGDLAVATSLLFPGMSRQKGTPEGRIIERSGLAGAEVARMKTQVEGQLSMKALVDGDDFSLVKWFHDNGVPQVVTMDIEVFKYK